MIIELATTSDVNELECLYDDLNDYLESNVNYPDWKKGVYPTRVEAESAIDLGTLYVARNHNGKIVGTIVLSHVPETAYLSVKWQAELDYKLVWIIHTFAVHPKYLKNGIGKQLLDFTQQLAKDTGIMAIRLDTAEHNDPASRLYEKCGYRYIDTVNIDYGSTVAMFKLYELLLLDS